MKKIIFTLMALGVAGYMLPATAQDNPPAPEPATAPAIDTATPAVVAPADASNGNATEAVTPPADATAAATDQTQMPADQTADQTAPEGTNGGSAVILPSQPLGMDRSVQSNFTPPTEQGTNANDLNLNFNRAPIDMVLNYLSDAAGFIIVLDTRVNGTVSVTGKHLNKDEAVDLLNSVLNKNGYAAIRSGRTLTIVDKNDAKTRDIPVKVSNNPQDIPKNDEIVTQIIPIRFVEARQLVSDLSSFVSAQATVVANEAGNSIVITDTQSNIRHLAEIIKAIDDSAEAETEIRVFHLKYASPTDVATELTSVFPSGGGSGGATQSPIRFGGGGGGGNPFARFFGGGGGGGGGGQGGGGGSGGSSADRIKKATQVTVVADARIQAVIVTAPKDLIEEIAGVMKDLDVPSDRDQNVYVFKTKNGDPQQMLTVLQSMFQSSSSRNSSSSSANSALQQRATTTATTTSSSSSTTGFGSTGGGGGGRGGGGGF